MEDPERGVYANDTKLGAKRAWGRYTKVLMADNPTLNSVFRKINILETQFDVDSLRHRFQNKDLIVLEGQDALEIARELEPTLADGIELVVVKNRRILEAEFGLIPDNPIFTARYMQQTQPTLSGKFAYLEYDSSSKSWKEVVDI